MNPILEKTFIAGTGGVTKYAVVVAGANSGEVVLPSSANAGNIIGVAQHNAAAGEEVRVMLMGRTRVKLAGAVSAGDFLQIAGATGTVRAVGAAYNSADNQANVVGIAQESGASGDEILALICIGANPITDRVFTADGAITAYAVVVAGSSSGTVSLPGAANADHIMGVAQNAAADGGMVVVRQQGVSKVISSAGVSQGDFLQVAGADGTVQTLALFADTNAYYCGIAQESASNGATLTMLIQIGMAQGEPAGG
jgi:hypothetical protein